MQFPIPFILDTGGNPVENIVLAAGDIRFVGTDNVSVDLTFVTRGFATFVDITDAQAADQGGQIILMDQDAVAQFQPQFFVFPFVRGVLSDSDIAAISAQISSDITNQNDEWGDALGIIAFNTSERIATDVANFDSGWDAALGTLSLVASTQISGDIVGGTNGWPAAVDVLTALSNAALTAISTHISTDFANQNDEWGNATLRISEWTSARITADILGGARDWIPAIGVIAAAILADPANLLATDTSGAVTTTGGTADLTPVLTRLDTVDTELARVKKLDEQIRHTLVDRVEGVSNTTVESRA